MDKSWIHFKHKNDFKKAATLTIGLAAFFVFLLVFTLGCGAERATTSTTPRVEEKTEPKNETVIFTSVNETTPLWLQVRQK